MIINCICGKKKFKLADELMPSEGSKVRCGSCSEVWFYHPNQGNLAETEETPNLEEPIVQNDYQEETKSEPNYNQPSSNISEEQTAHPSEELLPDVEGEELLDKDLFKDSEIEEDNSNKVSEFKIFSEEDSDLPSKEEMDKNLDNLKIERDKNLNFFQRLFKRDRIRDARNALKKKHEEEKYEEKSEVDVGRRTRLLFYLLILLSIVFSVTIVPMREDISAAFPFMKSYLEFLVPVYEHIKVPLKLQ
ncbi:zinc-ribbon domain-containing protein [Candidatus Pelagibacter sp.]|uniref:zinc-ribbon domain-containing protein n=1 Tax=Candidatus Pelagibacter sp. TaxID=2024849 RepID=UPI003F852387